MSAAHEASLRILALAAVARAHGLAKLDAELTDLAYDSRPEAAADLLSVYDTAIKLREELGTGGRDELALCGRMVTLAHEAITGGAA